MSEKVEVLNVNHPDQKGRVDAAKYHAMKAAILRTLQKGEPGMTQKDAMTAVKKHLPDDLFPGGATSEWWFKCVQLDLEARGILSRSRKSPLHFWQN